MSMPLVSIETPVFKGTRLRRCIDSVLYQSSPDWRFSLLWDGGDEESRMILEELDGRHLPNVEVHFAENRGIARARRYLTENSRGDFILPLDDDDALPFHAVERFLAAAHEKPWASIIRARREIVDENGIVLDTPPWFPFEPRHYQRGMVTDLLNHTHPYLIRRSAYDRTSGWEGFEDFHYAGEDCDIFLKLEELGGIELLDEALYYYRVHDQRASLVLTDEAAYEMWRRLADKTIARIGLPLRRTNEKQPFEYERLPRPMGSIADMDLVVVRDRRSTRRSLDKLTKALLAAGATEDQIRVVSRDGARHLNVAFAETGRPLIAVIDAGVRLDGTDPIGRLSRALTEHDADLVSPKLVNDDGFIVFGAPHFSSEGLPEEAGEGVWDEGQFDEVGDAAWLSERLVVLRREVVQAVGGVDEGYEHDRPAVIDLCLRARQRDFRCVHVGTVACSVGRSHAPATTEDLERLRRKWAPYPELL